MATPGRGGKGGGEIKIRKTELGEKVLNSEEEATTTFGTKSLKMFFCSEKWPLDR